ncbi:phage-related protein [Frigoribacterium sp. PvP120]|uniref:phage tail tape measure protein n=1 Tax=unclassified Frigoribacterium TaxID=2627005 RepID=UPI001AE3D5E8|nr:phage tail tape measure protein [Frigoribacterium sp. PvP121]MBP1241747.1 phage-related protein [Frigoribacterium sp. PvP121]
MATELATAYISLVPSMRGAQGEIARSLVPDASAAGTAAGGAAGATLGAGLIAALPVAAIGAALVGSFVGLYKVGSIFDDVTDTIRVGTGAQGEALQGLSDVAKDVATSVPASFEDAGTAVADLNTRLGLSGDSLTTVASQYLEAGRILGTEVDIQSTTAAFSAFGIEGDAVSGALDELFQVSQATGVGMNELAASVQKNAPAVQNLGFSFSETAALAGSLDKAGLNTGAIMGSLSKSLVTLAKDGQEPQAAFEGVITQLEGFISAGDTASAIDLAGKVFGTKGASQLVGAIQSGTLALDDLVGAAGLSGDTILGVAAETADFAESWTLVKNNALSALEPLSTAVFNLAGGAMAEVATKARELAPVISEGLTAGLAVVGPLLSSVGAALGPVLASVGSSIGPLLASLGTALGPLVTSVLQVWQAFSPLALIFGVIQPLLPTLLGAFTQLATTLGGALTTVLQSLLTALAPVVTVLSSTLTSTLVSILPVILQVATTLGGVLAGALTTLAPQLGLLAATVGSVLTTTLAALSPVLGMVAGLIASVLTAVLPLVPVILSLVTAIAPLVVQLIGALAPVLSAVVPLFGAIISAITPLITTIIGVLVPVISALLPVVTTVFGVIVDIITAALQIVQGIIQVVTGVITGNWSQVWAGLGNIVSGAWNLIQSVVTGALAIVGSVISTALNGIKAVFSAAWNGLTSIVSGAWSAVSGAVSTGVQTAIRFVAELPGKAADALGNLGSTLAASGRALIQGFIDGIKAMVGKVGDAVGGVLDFAKGLFPNSPADRGPFSGAGWTRVKKSGSAILDAAFGDLDERQVDLSAAIGFTATGASAFLPRGASAASLRALQAPVVAAPAGGLPDRIALVDQDGSILALTRVVARDEVASASQSKALGLSTGRQRGKQ